jgi:hypothetical protein
VAELRITDLPPRDRRVRFAADFGQRFVLTVDTEEEFDWDKPLAKGDHSVHTVPRLGKFQQFCEGLGVCPIYLIDYPVANSPVAADVLRAPVAEGRAEIGIQLHPWVSPPHNESVNEFNSFAGNLPPELERAKFLRLRDRIEQNFGVTPQIYRAGRYGAGPATAAMLSDAGIAVDTSVRARFDYSASGGPNYRDFPVEPWWIDRAGGLMELPLTTVYWGPLRRQGPWLYPKMWRVPRLRGALARIGLLERIPLTPEGVTLEEAIRGIDMAIDDGLPVLVFSFHSPSLAPGYTPYVRSEEDLDQFYAWWRGVFTYLRQRGIAPAGLRDIIGAAELA